MKTIFLILWIIFAIIGIFFGVIAYKNGDLEMKHGLEFSDIHICSSPTDITSRVTTISQKDIVDRSVQLFVCGVIKYSKPESIRILIYKEPSNRPIYYNQPSDMYSPGELFFPINLQKIDSVGDYKVVAYFYRYIVGTTSFTVTE